MESLEDELKRLLNRHSQENDSNTPDFILAEYLLGCLKVFNTAVRDRDKWYGRENVGPGQSSAGATVIAVHGHPNPNEGWTMDDDNPVAQRP